MEHNTEIEVQNRTGDHALEWFPLGCCSLAVPTVCKVLCVTAGFRRGLNKVFVLLGCYAA